MRLTLRTLLSWKDGMLDAAAAHEFAARVGANESARRLVERIDDATSRPTLPAPAPDAAGFTPDANTTAEYLDNVLEPGQLAEFERACFQSDVLLAETAATHEMLASWWREPPGELSASSRRRLLAAARERVQTDEPVATAEPGLTAVPSRPRVAAAPAPRAAAPARAPATAWLLVGTALLLFVALVTVLGWSLTRGAKRPADRRDVAARPADQPVRADAPAADVGAAPVDAPTAAGVPAEPEPAPPPSATADGNATVEPGAPLATSEVVVPARVTDAPSSAPAEPEVPAAPAAAPAPPAAGDRRVPQGDALAIAAPAAPPPGAVPAPPAAPAAPATPTAAPLATVVGPAVLLHRPSAAAQAAWLAGAAAAPLELPVELVAPPCGAPVVDVGGMRITLQPGTRAALARDADGTPRLEVVFGAAVVAGPGRVGITAGELSGIIAPGPGVPAGVEVRLERGPGDAADATRRVARILPAAAQVEWRQTALDGGVRETPLTGIGPVVAVPFGQALVWRSDRPEEATVGGAGPSPAWLVGRRADDPIDARAAQALAARLATGTPAVPALRELAADRRVERRLAAAATLAMLGEFADLARLLAADGAEGLRENEWQRLDAAAVQPALARGPKAADALARALAEQGPPGAADTIVRFARGFTDEQLASGADGELVAALQSPHLTVRRYAIRNLVEITGARGAERLHYRADWPDVALREKGAGWWAARLEQGRIRRGAAPP